MKAQTSVFVAHFIVGISIALLAIWIHAQMDAPLATAIRKNF